MIGKLFTDGIAPNPSDNLQVSVGENMTVVVNAGFAICGSCLKLEEESRTLAVQASDVIYDRIDTVVLRLNTNDDARNCDLYVLQGVPAASPIRPNLTRTSTIWELGLADIFVSKGSGAISEARITDTRYDAERCGVISSVSRFDTTTIYEQVQADLAEFRAEEQADFIAWYEQVKGQLSEDAAGNLQVQIDALNTELSKCFRSGSDGKALVASAITAQGVNTAEDATFQTMHDNILAINAGEEFINAVVDGLAYSGLGIAADTDPEDIKKLLLAAFPEVFNVFVGGQLGKYVTTTELINDITELCGEAKAGTKASKISTCIVGNFDVSNYNKLIFKYSTGGSAYYGNVSVEYGLDNTTTEVGTSVTNETVEIDVSNMSGIHDLVFKLSAQSLSDTYGADASVAISEIKLTQ